VAEVTWLQLIGTAVGSALLVKFVDIGYQEVLRRSERARTAARFVDEHLDPVLKAADELFGKLLALGKEDFRSLRTLDGATAPAHSNELGGLILLDFGRRSK
jgi:hypothetical protein